LAAFVLVHGAYHGGWCWRDVVGVLAAQGHEVHTPTLTGLGERAHLATPEINLSTHIQDIVNVFAWEDIDKAVLVGHSYGGMVISGVADRLAERLSALVYLDAVVPESGQSVVDLQPAARARDFARLVEENDGFRLPAVPAEFYGVTDPDQAAWANAKCVGQPWGTFTEHLELSEKWLSVPRKTYIRCTQTPLDYMDAFAAHAADDPEWESYALETGHDCMLTEPDRLAAMLMAQL